MRTTKIRGSIPPLYALIPADREADSPRLRRRGSVRVVGGDCKHRAGSQTNGFLKNVRRGPIEREVLRKQQHLRSSIGTSCRNFDGLHTGNCLRPQRQRGDVRSQPDLGSEPLSCCSRRHVAFRFEQEVRNGIRRRPIGEEQSQGALINNGLLRTTIVNFRHDVCVRRKAIGCAGRKDRIAVPRRPTPEPLTRFLNREYRGSYHARVARHVFQRPYPPLCSKSGINDNTTNVIGLARLNRVRTQHAGQRPAGRVASGLCAPAPSLLLEGARRGPGHSGTQFPNFVAPGLQPRTPGTALHAT